MECSQSVQIWPFKWKHDIFGPLKSVTIFRVPKFEFLIRKSHFYWPMEERNRCEQFSWQLCVCSLEKVGEKMDCVIWMGERTCFFSREEKWNRSTCKNKSWNEFQRRGISGKGKAENRHSKYNGFVACVKSNKLFVNWNPK